MKTQPVSRENKNLDIRALKIFEVVAATGSLSIAAGELQITQSAVSQAVAQIEYILGAAVLDRSRRPLRLTPAGIALSRHAHRIVHDMDRLIAQVREASLANRPEIRVGMIDSFAATVGPAILKKVTLSASQVLLHSGLAYSHAQSLLNRQLDLIVTSDPMEDMDSLVRRLIFTEPFMVVVPRVRLEQCEGADLRELINAMPFIRFSGRSHFGAIILKTAMFSEGTLFWHVLASARRVMTGFFAATLIAVPLGIVLGTSRILCAVFDPILSLLRPLPSMSWVPLSLLWFGITETQKYSIVFMGTFAPALIYVIEATRGIDPILIRAARNLGANRWQLMREIILPGSLPQIISGLKVILGLSWTCVISAELVAARDGLGFLIMNGKEFFQTDVVVLGMVMISLTVLITDILSRMLEKKLLAWQQ